MEEFTLVGIDGNAFSVMGYTANAMCRTGFEKPEIEAYFADAKSSDYNHLLAVSIAMIDKVNAKIKEVLG